MKTLKTILTGFTLILCQQLCAQQTDSAPDLPYSNKIEISPMRWKSFSIHPMM